MSAAPSLEDLLEKLDSLDSDVRFEALEKVARYAGHRKVNQAVFLLRNDPDRRVRTLARDILEEADRRTSEALSVVGGQKEEEALYLDELLKGMKAVDPTDRVTALKELRILEDPRAIAAVEAARKDGNRIVRMLAEEAFQTRKKNEKRPTKSRFEGNVMVSSPASERPKLEWRERAAGGLGPEMVIWLGLLYVVLGLPIAGLTLYLWADVIGAFDPKGLALLDRAWAPAAGVKSFALGLGLPATERLINGARTTDLNVFFLSVAFGLGAIQSIGGIALMLRRETGRRAVLLYHAILFIFGMLLPGAAMKLVPGFIGAIVVYYLTRPNIIATFRGAPQVDAEAKPAAYGEMERKSW